MKTKSGAQTRERKRNSIKIWFVYSLQHNDDVIDLSIQIRQFWTALSESKLSDKVNQNVAL